MTPLSTLLAQIEEIRERHKIRIDDQGKPWCDMVCVMPCDALKLAEKLETAVKALEDAERALRLIAGASTVDPLPASVRANIHSLSDSASDQASEALSRMAALVVPK